MAHKVKCVICQQEFDRDKIEAVQIAARRYAHATCVKSNEELAKETKDKDTFFQMVKSIYGKNYNYMLINTQAERMRKEHGYTWSGMTGCLHWFYNLNHGNLEDGHGGIGIIPFIYEEVKDFYQKIYLSQQENEKKNARAQVVTFNIQSPRAWSQPPRLLNLEDDDE